MTKIKYIIFLVGFISMLKVIFRGGAQQSMSQKKKKLKNRNVCYLRTLQMQHWEWWVASLLPTPTTKILNIKKQLLFCFSLNKEEILFTSIYAYGKLNQAIVKIKKIRNKMTFFSPFSLLFFHTFKSQFNCNSNIYFWFKYSNANKKNY